MSKKMVKKAEKAKKKSVSKPVVTKVATVDDLQGLAHEGTKEAMIMIERFIESVDDLELRAYGEMALEECEFLLYQPTNDTEEQELMLCALIERRERNRDDIDFDVDEAKLKVEKLTLEKNVHDRVLSSHKKRKVEWEYFWIEDFMTMAEQDLRELESELEYEIAWIAEARKMITTERYKDISSRFLSHFDFDFEDESFDEDDDFDDDACNCEDCDACTDEFCDRDDEFVSL
jgi:hypothetical protein